MRTTARRRRSLPGIEALDDRRLLSGYTPAQIQSAYGLAPIAWTSASGSTATLDGSGQTIAIVGAYHNPTLQSDLAVFSEAFGLPPADVTVVNLGGEATDPTWASESAMDVQWAHALAPGASILLVEAASDSGDDVMAAVDYARNVPGVVAVSLSFGFTETAGQHSYDSHFTTPAGHGGITFIAASGDHGPAGGAMFPASSPNVLGVGGTTLALDASGAVQSESLWAKSGSGPGRYSNAPGYQSAFQPGGRKTTPDVVFLGDPDTGVSVYHTNPGDAQGSWRVVAGTSLGAPAWAAMVAMVAQGRALEGKGSLDGATETLPILYGLAGTGFRPVGNDVSSTAAGLGAPDGRTLIPALIRGATQPVTPIRARGNVVAPTPVRPIRRSPSTIRRTPVVAQPVQNAARQARLARQALRVRRPSPVG